MSKYFWGFSKKKKKKLFIKKWKSLSVLHCYVASPDSSHLQSTAGVKSLLWVRWTQPDLRIWLLPQVDIILHFSVERKKKKKKVLNGMWKKRTWSSNSLTSYLARWSTASMTLVPSLALVSQNKAPYACKQSINIPDSTLFIETPGGTGRLYKQFDITQNERYTPWPTSLRANCSHSFPRDAALGGRPYFQ